MSDFIGIDIKEVPPLGPLLRKLPETVRDLVVDEVAEYLINVLRKNAPYRYVSRYAAYGQTFVSDKQRKFVMAAIREGRIMIPYKRSQNLSKSWKQIGKGYQSIIVNEAPYAAYVVGDDDQTLHEAKVGWEKVGITISTREDQIERRALAAAQKAINHLGA